MTPQQAPTMHEDDRLAELVSAAQHGDRQAFGELVTRYQRMVYIILSRRLRNHAEAEELCQEVFIQALRKIGQLHDPQRFGGWLCTIASRMAINRAKRRGPVVPAESDVFEANCVESRTPLGDVLSRERQDQVHLGLERLRTLDRDTLVAFYFQGQSLVQMSKQFGSPIGTIKRRLHTARKRLAKELEALVTA